MPAAATTLRHFPTSVPIKAANSSGDRAEVIAMTTSGIRELQAAWIDFGLHELSAPQVLLARSPDADETEPFTPIALEGFLAPKSVSATQLQVAWRARQHPFFDQRAARDQSEASPR